MCGLCRKHAKKNTNFVETVCSMTKKIQKRPLFCIIIFHFLQKTKTNVYYIFDIEFAAPHKTSLFFVEFLRPFLIFVVTFFQCDIVTFKWTYFGQKSPVEMSQCHTHQKTRS